MSRPRGAHQLTKFTETSTLALAPAPPRLSWRYGTGRRKEAVARVRLSRVTAILINGRTLEENFLLQDNLQREVNSPIVLPQARRQVRRYRPRCLTAAAPLARLRYPLFERALNAIDRDANRAALKKAGFLTRDARVVERKKAGLHKARRAPQFSSVNFACPVLEHTRLSAEFRGEPLCLCRLCLECDSHLLHQRCSAPVMVQNIVVDGVSGYHPQGHRAYQLIPHPEARTRCRLRRDLLLASRNLMVSASILSRGFRTLHGHFFDHLEYCLAGVRYMLRPDGGVTVQIAFLDLSAMPGSTAVDFGWPSTI